MAHKKYSVNWKSAVAGAVLVTSLGMFCLLATGNLFSNLSYDLLFAFKPTEIPNEVVMIYMDDDSHRSLRQPWLHAWDRSVHAALIEKLRAVGVQTVVFDILFDSPNLNDPQADEKLVQAARSHGNVVVAGKVDPVLVNGEEIGWKPTPPFDSLRAATTWGLVEGGASDDVIRRHFPGTERIPSLALAAAGRAFPDRPLAPAEERWMNYYGPPGTIPWVSYHQLLEAGAITPSALSNRVAFVGALFNVGFTGGRGTDDFRTPFSWWSKRRAPGAEINATAFLNLFRGDWLVRLPPLLEFLMVLALGGGLGFGSAWVRPKMAALLGLLIAALAFLAASYGVAAHHVWFSWLVVSAVEVPIAVACCVFSNARRLQSQMVGLESALQAAQESKPAPLVHFLLVAPATTSPGSSFAVEIWAYRAEDREQVLKRASQDASDTGTLPGGDWPATSRGVSLSVKLSLLKVHVLAREESILWSGQPCKASFLVEVPADCPQGANAGLVAISVQGLRIASLHFRIQIASGQAGAARSTFSEHRHHKAFACYATPDRAEVLARVQGMQKTLPDLEVFLDVHSIRSGQDWEQAVRKAILDCDIFYLFWSENAQKSPEVEKEWRYALEQKGRDFIDPVPLVSPVKVQPPAELAGKHFNDWTLALVERSRKP